MNLKVICLLTFLVGSTAMACPDLSGTYLYQNKDYQLTAVITQTACQSLVLNETYVPAKGQTVTANYNLPLDGNLHRYDTAADGITHYLAAQYDKNHLMISGKYINADGKVAASGIDDLTLDSSTGTLTDKNTFELADGKTQHSTATFTRQQ
jgi:hypothetical protein